MTARRPWEEGAGPWVSWIERPHIKHPAPAVMRDFRWAPQSDVRGFASWTAMLDDALRYDTKAEALADIAGPRRKGMTRHAMRYEEAKRLGIDTPEARHLPPMQAPPQ